MSHIYFEAALRKIIFFNLLFLSFFLSFFLSAFFPFERIRTSFSTPFTNDLFFFMVLWFMYALDWLNQTINYFLHLVIFMLDLTSAIYLLALDSRSFFPLFFSFSSTSRQIRVDSFHFIYFLIILFSIFLYLFILCLCFLLLVGTYL